MTAEIDHEYTIYPTCPHCGHEDADWWEGDGVGVDDGESWVDECGNCGKKYIARKLESVRFDTEAAGSG